MNEEQLAPHAPDAERGVLGCILFDTEHALPGLRETIEYFQGEQPFYDLRHDEILQAMKALAAGEKPVNVFTLLQYLRDVDKLNAVGGHEYVATLPDAVPAPTMLPMFLAMVWEKYQARKGIQTAKKMRDRFVTGMVSEASLEETAREIEEIKAASARHLETQPKNLSDPTDFEKEYFATWFRESREEPGWHLPFEFPLKIRPNEMTLVTGDNGTGKSSLLGLISIALGCQQAKICVASLEVPPPITLWIMARQLLGTGHLDKNEDGVKRATRALGWLQRHVKLYNFLGITDWRMLMDTFHFARKHYGTEVFIVDSVMRIGIQDDDYAMQGIVAARFADFAVKTGAHVFLVIHENKGDRGNMKEKVRGSKQWTDNAHNIVGMLRNVKKADVLSDLEEKFRTKEMSEEQYKGAVAEQGKFWDAKFLLSKQRYPGSRQNGSKYLWFDRGSLQFHDRAGVTPTNYLMKAA